MARRRERGVSAPGEPARMPAAGHVCGEQAGPPSCVAAVFSRGLCRRHYRRAAKGLPIDPNEVAIGSPAGHGRYGLLDPDPTDPTRLTCHTCGHSYIALGVHIGMTHDGGVRAYRLTYGLPMSTALIGPELQARLAAVVDPATTNARLGPVRTPDNLREVDPDLINRGQRLLRAGRSFTAGNTAHRQR